MILADTNIFLEILLKQQKESICRQFIEEHADELTMSDFTLHSIGIILFRNNKADVFGSFIDDILPAIKLVALPQSSYPRMLEINAKFGVDFDDAYQFAIAQHYDMQIATMDIDYKKTAGVPVLFL